MTGPARATVRNLRARLAALTWRERPMPRVDIGLGRWVPGWVFRVAGAGAVAALLLLTASRTELVPSLAGVLAGALALWSLARPGAGPAHVAVVLAAVVLLGSATAPFDPAALWLAPLGYVTTRLGWWAAVVVPTERVELAAVRRVALRDLVLTVVTVAVGLASWAVSGRPVEGIVALGVAALAAVAWLVAGRHDDR